MSDAFGSYAAAFASAALLSFGTTRLLIPLLSRAGSIDVPNARSSHDRPTPRGGGLGILAGFVAGLTVFLLLSPDYKPPLLTAFTFLSAVILLGVVSLTDDFGGLPPLMRFLVHISSVGIGLTLLPASELIFQGILPFWLDRAATAFVWLWFINLFNFMDGIDGIAASESASIGLGLAAVATILLAIGASFPFATMTGAIGMASAGASIGFLFWNWQRARIFMGDIGSITLGWILGLCLLTLAAEGFWAVALLLPAVFLADATLTLLKRIARRERFWAAHRSHFYQKAAAERGHAAVVIAMILTNTGLIAAALISLWSVVIGLALGLGLTAGLLVVWQSWRAPRQTKPEAN